MILPVGKLDSKLLENIVFDKIRFKRPEVLVRPGIGEDCAVVDFGKYECVMSTDPITASVADIGRLAIHISCNDVASNGVEPIGIMLAVMLPVGTTKEQVETIMNQAATASEKVGVEIIGGHTEITPAVSSPVIVSTAFGRSLANSSTKDDTGTMQPGDRILMTKWAGLEGTGIIACDYQDQLKDVLTEEELAMGENMLDYVSVVKEGVIAGKIGTHGMHDITEGGLLGAVWEMCHVGKVGARIHQDKVVISPITEKLCRHYGINPLRLISSGCMLIIAAGTRAERIKKALLTQEITVADIGEITTATEGIYLEKDGVTEAILPPTADELYKVVAR